MISLRNFARSGHSGSFRSIVGEAGEVLGAMAKDLGRVGRAPPSLRSAFEKVLAEGGRHSIKSVTDGGRLSQLTIEFAADLLLRHGATVY